MPKANIDLLAFNRGLISPLALARTDVERTRLSAETFINFTPKTQGAMRLRPGGKYLGSSYNDTGAAWIEFVASTNDKALLELTPGLMRVWIDDALLARDTGVDTTVAGVLAGVSDTGAWVHTDTGGSTVGTPQDQIPDMTDSGTDGVTIAVSDFDAAGEEGWRAGDDSTSTVWQTSSPVPQWLSVNFGGNKTITTYTVRAGGVVGRAPRSWRLLGSAAGNTSDTGTWTFLDSGGDQTGWSASEKRTFTIASPGAFQHYGFFINEVNGSPRVEISEIELLPAAPTGQSHFNSVGLVLNAQSIGGRAGVRQLVTCDTGNQGVEHGLAINVTRGPVTFRVGSSAADDDYIEETSLATGRHSLSLIPTGDFYINFESSEIVDRIVASLSLEAGGTVSVITPWTDTGDVGAVLDDIRFAQSADVVFVACYGKKQTRIERRGIGRSWSVVDYVPIDGPFNLTPSTTAQLTPAATYGNTTLAADKPTFESGHVGALFRAFHDGQGGVYILGNTNAFSDVWKVTGINDTGTGERQFTVARTGTFVGTLSLQRSFTGADDGFQTVRTFASDTGTETATINDTDDNITVWYRIGILAGNYTSGAKTVTITYSGGGKDGVARVTDFNSSTSVNIEVLSRFSQATASKDWAEVKWSDARSWPSSVEFHEGRLWWFGGAQLFGSVSDDYANWNAATTGDSAPISRTLATGPVDRIHYGVSLIRLFVGTAGEEVSLRSTSLDEPLTTTNMVTKSISTQGSANLRAFKVDDRAVFVQRSGRRVFMISYDAQIGDYRPEEMTLLVPDLLSNVTSLAVQRQPDTRLHFVLDDGSVAIATYEAQEQVLCWSLYKSDAASGFVERVMVLPGTTEDQVYYQVKRTVNGATKRFLERQAMESEAIGETVSWMADCAIQFTDTGQSGTTTITGLDHLVGAQVIAWGNDTGTTSGMDLSPDDTGGNQTLYTVDTGGNIELGTAKRSVVAGLPYRERTTGKEMDAEYKSTKLAYAAAAGTALTMPKRVDHIGVILGTTHNKGLFYGKSLTITDLQPLPRVVEGREIADSGEIFSAQELTPFEFPGDFDTDARMCLAAKAPRPCTLLAAILSIATHDKL